MRIVLDDAQKMQEYIKHHVGEAHNLPMLRTALQTSLKLLDRYYNSDKPEVQVKLGS